MKGYPHLKCPPLSLRGTKQPRNYTGRIEKFEICMAEMHSYEVASANQQIAMTKFGLGLNIFLSKFNTTPGNDKL